MDVNKSIMGNIQTSQQAWFGNVQRMDNKRLNKIKLN